MRILRRLGGLLLGLFLIVGVAAAAVNDARELTEVERLKVEVLTLKAQLVRSIADADTCRVELAPIRSQLNARAIADETAALKAAIDAAHPGSRWNPRTGLLEAAPETPSPKGTP